MALITLTSWTPAAAREPDDGESAPVPVQPTPESTPFVVPEGIYYVTETYVADVVTTTGPTTTYSTTTVHQSTGTYARIVDTVGTGGTSVFDGAAFNGRGALTDGRGVAGTYYENFVLTPDGFVPVNIVFFQDDSETAQRRSTAPSVVPLVTMSPPVTSSTSGAASAAAFAPTSSQRPVVRPSEPITVPPPAPRILRAGIALAPDGPMLATAELLRGQAVQFWPRVFVNDVAVPIRSWRLVSHAPDYAAPMSGSDQPFVGQWLRMPTPATPWLLRFEVLTDVGGERVDAQISIVVRSPALID